MNTRHILPSDIPLLRTEAPQGAAWHRALHRGGGLVLALYALMHLGNHLVALRGVVAHQQVQEALRLLYRHPLVEPVLLAVVVAQVGSGVARAWTALRGRRLLHGVARVQAVSGLVLGSFVLIHVVAVLGGRWLGLDTNFYYAAAGLHVVPYGWFFAPYYVLGVAALGVHLGCAVHWALARHGAGVQAGAAWALALAGVGLGVLLCLLLAGAIVPVEIPAAYRATFGV